MASSSELNTQQQPQQEQQQEQQLNSRERLLERLDDEIARLGPDVIICYNTYDNAILAASRARSERLSGTPEGLIVRHGATNWVGQQGQASNGIDSSNGDEDSLIMSALRAVTLALTKPVNTPRMLSPSGLADFSDEMRVAVAKLSMPLLTDPDLIEAAIERAHEFTRAARREPAGSELAISLHQRSLSLRIMAHGMRSGSVSDVHHDLGVEYLAAGRLREASRSLCDAMRTRNERDFDGDEIGPREAAADTREVYGKVAEALADFGDARHVRLEGLGWGRVRCAGVECHTMLVAETLASCRNCRSVFYCSRECQATDWHARHRPLCKAFIAKLDRLNITTSQIQPSATIDIPLVGVTNAVLAAGSPQTLSSWDLIPKALGLREWSGVEDGEVDMFDDIEKREKKRIRTRV